MDSRQKCLDFRDDPGRQEREVKTNPQPIKESGILRRKGKPKSAVQNSVKGTLDTYAKIGAAPEAENFRNTKPTKTTKGVVQSL